MKLFEDFEALGNSLEMELNVSSAQFILVTIWYYSIWYEIVWKMKEKCKLDTIRKVDKFIHVRVAQFYLVSVSYTNSRLSSTLMRYSNLNI